MIWYPGYTEDNLQDAVMRVLKNPSYYPYIGAGLGYLAGTGAEFAMDRRDQPFYQRMIPLQFVGAATGALAGYGASKIMEKKSAYTAMSDIVDLIVRDRGY